jgi:hypothetical protein
VLGLYKSTDEKYIFTILVFFHYTVTALHNFRCLMHYIPTNSPVLILLDITKMQISTINFAEILLIILGAWCAIDLQLHRCQFY